MRTLRLLGDIAWTLAMIVYVGAVVRVMGVLQPEWAFGEAQRVLRAMEARKAAR